MDSCTRLCLLEPDPHRLPDLRVVPVAGSSAAEPANAIKQLCVAHILCAPLSDAFHTRLRAAGIGLSCVVSGNVQEVMEAWRNETLKHARGRTDRVRALHPCSGPQPPFGAQRKPIAPYPAEGKVRFVSSPAPRENSPRLYI